MMPEQSIQLEIPVLIPGLTDHQDGCITRLEQALHNRKGILKVHVKAQQSPMVLCLHYNPVEISGDDIRGLAARAGASIAGRFHHEAIPVEGMDCSDCVVVLEHGLRRTEGVLNANVSYAGQVLKVEYDAKQINRTALEKRVEQLGYRVPARGLRKWISANREVLLSLAGGLFLLLAWGGETFLSFSPVVALGLYLLAYVVSAWDVAHHAWHALKERRFDTDLLMIVAALGAAALGEFAEGGLLLFLFGLGHALEERALDHARDAVRSLGQMMPKTAIVRRAGNEVEVAVDHLEPGETVYVQPGVRIPVDGRILAGRSGLDQSPVTGESLPVDKGPGDGVFAGSVNGEGALEIQVERLARDSTLARVMKMVEDAQAQKSPTQQVTERVMRWFVPAVLASAILLIVLPPLFGVPLREAFLRAMTLLVAASPCALALGTPAAVLAGVARAARGGVLIKGGAHLENLGQLRAIAFDKTGTITRGRPELAGVYPAEGVTEDELLALAAAVESRSAHPLAQAVLRGAQQRGLALPEVGEAQAVTGLGMQAEVNGEAVRVGNSRFFAEAGIDLPLVILERAKFSEALGQTAIIVWQKAGPLGVIAVADTIRPEAVQALRDLRRLGVRQSVLLTGDNRLAAGAIAQQADIQEVQAGLLPGDKLRAVQALVAQHGVTAMVGDGVNDAPALAHATVGIAMGGAGTDVALETADVALMGDDLRRLPFAVGLGKAARGIILQNLVIALGVIAVLVVAAVSGWASIGAAVVFHEGSTILVVLNALRLLAYKR